MLDTYTPGQHKILPIKMCEVEQLRGERINEHVHLLCGSRLWRAVELGELSVTSWSVSVRVRMVDTDLSDIRDYTEVLLIWVLHVLSQIFNLGLSFINY